MHIPFAEAKAKLQNTDSPFLNLFSHGSLSIELYKPDQADHQKPHIRNEVYIIASGNGKFISDGKIIQFQKHDFLFVPAGIEHRFIDFTDDFTTWVIFYGPEGGES